ncbi:hypothetical protein Tco_0638610 [Tanacetum coccineum]
MASSHNQSIADARSKNHPLMLEKCYAPWSSRFLRYIDGKKDYGKMLNDSILNGLYKMQKMMDQGNPIGNPPVPPFERYQKEANLTGDDKKCFKEDIDAMNAILLGIPNDIYNSIDACKTAQAMWQWVKRLMQGEYIESYCLRLSKIMNDLERHDCLPKAIDINTKAKRAARTHDLLALVANHYVVPSSSRTSPAYYVTHPSSVNDFDGDNQLYEFQGDAGSDDETDNLITSMMLEQGRFSRNSGNATFGQQASGNNVNVKRVPRTSANLGNTSTVKCYNYNEKCHLTRVCPKPRVRDSNYFKEEMLLAKKDEAGIDLNDGENDLLLADIPDEEVLEELNATCIMTERIQTINNDSEAGPSYDSDIANEVHDSQKSFINDMFAKYVVGNSENDEQDNNVHDHKTADFELFIRNVQIESEKTNKISKAVKEENDLLKTKLRNTRKRSWKKVESHVRNNNKENVTSNANVSKTNASVMNVNALKMSHMNLNVMCVYCGNCVFTSCLEKCVAKYVLSVNSKAKRALFTSLIAAKTKSVVPTPIAVKTRFVVATPLTLKNKISSSTPQTPVSKQDRTPGSYMKNKAQTSRKCPLVNDRSKLISKDLASRLLVYELPLSSVGIKRLHDDLGVNTSKDVIENGNSFKPATQTTTNANGTSTTLIPGLVTTEEKVQKKNDVKARIFGGNEGTQKTQKLSLNQMYEKFSAPSTKSLDFIFNRLQKIIIEQVVNGTASSAHALSSQNMAFVLAMLVFTVSMLTFKYDALCMHFLASQPNGSQLVYEDLEQIHEDDIEEVFEVAIGIVEHEDKKPWWILMELVLTGAIWQMMKFLQTWLLWLFQIDLFGVDIPVRFKGYGPKTSKNDSEDTSNEVRESPDALMVEKLVSNDKLEKKNVFSTVAKIEFVRPKQQDKLVRKPIKYAEMYRLTAITIKGKGCNLGIIIQKTHPSAHRNMVPRAVLMKSGLKSLNTAWPVTTAHPKTTVYSARPMSRFSKSAQSTAKSS